MHMLFSIIKVVAIIQLIVVILLLMAAYAIKVITYLKNVHSKKISLEIKNLFTSQIEQFDIENPRQKRLLVRNVALLISIINSLDLSATSERWKDVRQIVINAIILPKARVLAQSRAWENRFVACEAFKLSFEPQDESILKVLIFDPIPLVALNSAIIALQFDSQSLIDAVIDSFAKSRRVQQSGYAQIISGADVKIIPVIVSRLDREENPYIKAFCYHILTDMPSNSVKAAAVFDDVNSTNLDLRLAALSYLSHIDPKSSGELFVRLLQDERWEVRARSAVLLGEIGNDSFASHLEESLKDTEWWVRINAAEALTKLGKKGLAILERQDPDVDRYAYETAKNVLLIQSGTK